MRLDFHWAPGPGVAGRPASARCAPGRSKHLSPLRSATGAGHRGSGIAGSGRHGHGSPPPVAPQVPVRPRPGAGCPAFVRVPRPGCSGRGHCRHRGAGRAAGIRPPVHPQGSGAEGGLPHASGPVRPAPAPLPHLPRPATDWRAHNAGYQGRGQGSGAHHQQRGGGQLQPDDAAGHAGGYVLARLATEPGDRRPEPPPVLHRVSLPRPHQARGAVRAAEGRRHNFHSPGDHILHPLGEGLRSGGIRDAAVRRALRGSAGR